MCLLVRGAVCIELYAVYMNFGKGLRERGTLFLHHIHINF